MSEMVSPTAYASTTTAQYVMYEQMNSISAITSRARRQSSPEMRLKYRQ